MKQVIESSSDLQRIEVCQGVFRSKRFQRVGDLDKVDDIVLLSMIFLNYHAIEFTIAMCSILERLMYK